MSRQLYTVEKGLRIHGENTQAGVDILFGSGAPGGDTGEQDAAGVGSLYLRTNGQAYKKIGSANSAADWEEIGNVTLDQLNWRNEKVRAATVDTLSAGSVDPTSFSDNESGLDGNDFAVGEYLIGDVDGTPVLYEVTAVTDADDITIAVAGQVIADNDTFIVQKYLPDSPADQEGQAIVHFPSATGPAVKIGDVNWDFATGINLSGGYTPGSGNVTSADTVESAIQKLDGVNDAQDSALGLAQGDVNFGAFTGDSLADDQSAKQLFQRIETLLEQLRGVQATGITTVTTVDSVPVASVKACKWTIEAFEEATPANRQALEIFALNDGTNVDDTVYAKLKLGSNFNLSISVDIDSGNMRLRAASTTAGVTVTARRVEVVETVL